MVTQHSADLPTELYDWGTFLADWCLGRPPVLSEPQVAQALAALKRLLPDRFAKLLQSPTRGLGVVLPRVSLGRALVACEPLKGFDKVLARLQLRERGAYTEVMYASSLADGGCTVALEPDSGAAVLDTEVQWEGGPILTEVIAPERAEAIVAAQSDLESFAKTLCDAIGGVVVEVLFQSDVTSDAADLVRSCLSTVVHDSPLRIEGFATIVQRAAVVPLQLGPTLTYAGPDPILGVATGRVEGAPGSTSATGVVARMPLLDSRARRLLAAELHHFSRDTRNILAIDLTGVSVGPKNWAPLIQRSFQPGQNRRIGAVIFFSRGMGGEPFASRQVWSVVPNQYAYQPIPEGFLRLIGGLDESRYFGQLQPELAV